ncbi:protein FAM200B-like [Octopus sinensis]|uniref:Protein FAM200B-like n=1 Tax=Octopus sinensis TaxID=2607531 RepID=A0A6P7TXX6_9MOLL|nr:protein FAM200B-like [Octopus sinensis]
MKALGHRTRSKVQINEGMDEISRFTELSQEQVSKSKNMARSIDYCQTTKMSDKKVKRRIYSDEYLKFGVIPYDHNNSLPMCLMCKKVFTNEGMKPSRMLNHLKICHPDKLDADINYFSNLKYNYENRLMINQLFTKNSKMLEKGL